MSKVCGLEIRKPSPGSTIDVVGRSDIVESTNGLGNVRGRQLPTDGALHRCAL